VRQAISVSDKDSPVLNVSRMAVILPATDLPTPETLPEMASPT
jgi:hypothetical protein